MTALRRVTSAAGVVGKLTMLLGPTRTRAGTLDVSLEGVQSGVCSNFCARAVQSQELLHPS